MSKLVKVLELGRSVTQSMTISCLTMAVEEQEVVKEVLPGVGGKI